jgi:hypothetical protein
MLANGICPAYIVGCISGHSSRGRKMADSQWPSIRQLLGMSDAELSHQNLAAVNLACAVGLPGSEGLDIGSCLDRVEQWTHHVRFATRRAFENKANIPEYRDWSDARYRALMVQICLRNHLGVTGNVERMSKPYDGSDSRDLFIHAVLTDGHPTLCTTAPVVYAAIGRRLGYPIKLVETKCHIFCRWDDPHGERFNVEATDQGFYTHPDDHYRTWPYPWTAFEKRLGWWLKSLTPRQELALFLDSRGTCWLENLETKLAAACFSASCALDNTNPNVQERWAYATYLHDAARRIKDQRTDDSCLPFSPQCWLPKESWPVNYVSGARQWLNRIMYNRRDFNEAAIKSYVSTEIVVAV